MTWTFIWMMVVLKLPIFALLYIVWWASREVPDPAESSCDDGGSKRTPPPHPRSPRSRPRGRDPHGAPLPSSPARVRTATSGRAPRHLEH